MGSSERTIWEGKYRHNQKNKDDTADSSPNVVSEIIVVSIKTRELFLKPIDINVSRLETHLVKAEYKSTDVSAVSKVMV